MVDEAAEIVGRHPGVSHNYLRNHGYNLWYTIAVPPTSRLGLEGTVAALHRISGAEETRLLPTIRLFKIGVRFDMAAGAADDAGGPYFSEDQRSAPVPLTPEEMGFVRVMQRDLPLVPAPFTAMADELGMPFARCRPCTRLSCNPAARAGSPPCCIIARRGSGRTRWGCGRLPPVSRRRSSGLAG